MRIVVIWCLASCFFLRRIRSEDCSGPLSHSGKIFTNVSASFDFQLDRNNLSNSKLNIVFRWKVKDNIEYDGLMYKVKSTHVDGGGGGSQHGGSCINYNASIWRKNAEGDPVECDLPCPLYSPPICNHSNICYQLRYKGFAVLNKDERSVSVPANFGLKYDIRLSIYRDWHVSIDQGESYKRAMYCMEELTNNHNIPIEQAQKYCDKKQKYPDKHHYIGPPSKIEKEENGTEIVLTRNRANVSFRWKKPLDVSPTVKLEWFFIRTEGGTASSKKIRVDKHDDEGHYHVVVSGVELGKTNNITITPYYEILSCKTGDCRVEVQAGTLVYVIPDIDACAIGNKTTQYCGKVANCSDLPANATTPALCDCPLGYDGNGVNPVYTGGSDCFDHDACSAKDDSDYLCDLNAICIDLPPPDISMNCTCPPGYIGNGYRSGSGCTNLALVLATGIGIPAVIIAVLLIVAFIRRYNLTKKRTRERIMSKFIVSKERMSITTTTSNGYQVPDTKVVSSIGKFGNKWELDRDAIQFQEIIGRGSSGVVYKAVLKTVSGEKTVAVKTLQDGRTASSAGDFLYEISLISSLEAHDNVMGMIGCCTLDPFPVYLVTEMMKYGDLLHFLWAAREKENWQNDATYNLSESDIHCIGEQVAAGMEYLSSIKIVHGDLAARNILVDEELKCKITDFGLANDVYRYGSIISATERRVPVKWVSPERMSGGKVPISWRSDVWSYGILLYEAITLGATPYCDISTNDLLERLRSGYRMPRPTSCSQNLYNWMLQCWEWTPSKRPTFKDLHLRMKKLNATTDTHYKRSLSTIVASMQELDVQIENTNNVNEA